MMQVPIIDSRKNNSTQHPATTWTVGHPAAEEREFNSQVGSLTELIKKVPGAPKRTAILGETIDGLPLLFNLKDPRPGSLLLVADRQSNKTSLMKVLSASLAQLNRPEEVRFAVITARPDEWRELETRYPGHFMNIVAKDDPQAEDLIYHLCDLTEARQNGMHVGTAYVLFNDGMDSLAHMDVDVRKNFEWLVRCGAQQQIWPVASLDSKGYLTNNRVAELFRTRIIGAVADRQTAERLLPPRFHQNSAPDGSQRFTVRIHQHWLQFTLPNSLA